MSDEKKEREPVLGGVGLIVTVAVFIAGAFVLTPVLRSYVAFFDAPHAWLGAAMVLLVVASYFGQFVERFIKTFAKGWREGKAK
jgi:predicted Na+-dependent transporter